MSTEQERADFEAWFTREKGYPPQIDPDHRGKYLVGSAAQLHWVGWQARAALQSQDREDVIVQAIQEAIALLGPKAPSCSGCEYEWNHALRVLREAIDQARRIEGDGE